MQAMIFTPPPQWTQFSMSIRKTRLRRRAEVIARRFSYSVRAAVPRMHPVEKNHVKVNVEVQRTPESLNQRDRPGMIPDGRRNHKHIHAPRARRSGRARRATLCRTCVQSVAHGLSVQRVLCRADTRHVLALGRFAVAALLGRYTRGVNVVPRAPFQAIPGNAHRVGGSNVLDPPTRMGAVSQRLLLGHWMRRARALGNAVSVADDLSHCRLATNRRRIGQQLPVARLGTVLAAAGQILAHSTSFLDCIAHGQSLFGDSLPDFLRVDTNSALNSLT